MLARENLEVDAPDAAEAGDHDQLEQHQIVARRQWEQTYGCTSVCSRSYYLLRGHKQLRLQLAL